MLRRVALVEADVSGEPSACFRRCATASAVPSSPILVTLMKEALSFSETSALTRATRRNIHKTAFFIVTAVKTSNLTKSKILKTVILTLLLPSLLSLH
jgi:hypothetical protein